VYSCVSAHEKSVEGENGTDGVAGGGGGDRMMQNAHLQQDPSTFTINCKNPLPYAKEYGKN